MKIVSLNIWGGRERTPLLEFVTQEALSTDIFCFQEVFSGSTGSIMAALVEALPGFECHFLPVIDSYDVNVGHLEGSRGGQALFIRKDIPVDSVGGRSVYGSFGKPFLLEGGLTMPAGLQHAVVKTSQGPRRVAHVHGLGRPGSKLDTLARMEQSSSIVAFLSEQRLPTILCGDFNLMPETESIAMIERFPMRNLIKEFQITDTRGAFNRKKYSLEELQFFADYIFVSPEVVVRTFVVPEKTVSDHLPLILECE